MKYLRLSVLAVTVAAATACSSSSKNAINDYLSSQANASVQEANKKAEEAQQQAATKEQAATEEANQKLEEAQKAQQEAEVAAQEANKKAEEAQKAKLEAEAKAQAAIVEQQAAEKRLAEIEAARKEEERLAEEARQAEVAEQARIASNITELKKEVKDNGTFEKTYTKPADPWDYFSQPKEVTLTLSNVSGKHLFVENDNFSDKPLREQKDLNTLLLDGKEIALYTSEEIRASSTDANTGYATKSLNVDDVSGKVGSLSKSKYGSDFDQVRYGYVTENGKTTLFVQGHTTPTTGNIDSPFDRYNYGTTRQDQRAGLSAMPTGEKVWAYQGAAFYGKDGNYQELSVDAVADFGNKKVRAELKEGDALKVLLGGVINGNQFAGEYNGVHTQGAFYGDQAQDMGGMFYQTQGDEKDKNGVFGATSNGHTWRGGVNVPEKALTDFDVK